MFSLGLPAWGVAYIASLDEVSSNKQVLAIGGQLDVVRADDGLVLIRVVEALDVLQVGDVESGNVAADSDGEVGALAIRGDLGVDGGGVLGLVTEVVEELSNTLVAIGILAEGVDDPDLAGANSTVVCMSESRQEHTHWNVKMNLRGKGSRLRVAGDELDILDSLTL